MSRPCFCAVAMMVRRMANSAAPFAERKPPEIFCLSFIMRRARPASLSVKGTSGPVRKRRVASLHACGPCAACGRRACRPRQAAAGPHGTPLPRQATGRSRASRAMLRARRRSRCIRRARSSLSNAASACNARRGCAWHSACPTPFIGQQHCQARHARRHSPRAARSPDTPPAMAGLPAPADAQPGLIRMLHARPACCKRLDRDARPPQSPRSPDAQRRQHRRRYPRPEQHRQNLRKTPLRQKLRVTQPRRRPRKTRTLLCRSRHAHREPGPRHHPANDRSADHEPDAPPPPKGGALEGRTAGVQPLRRPAPHPTRTPHAPGNTSGYGPPHDPGAPHAAASSPCGPPDPPASPASSASGAGPPASQARRSRAACRCCGTSTQDGAPTPLSARQDAPLAPEALRSPPRGAQPAPPNSRIPTPTKALAASRTRSCAGSPMVPTHTQPTGNRKPPGQSRFVMVSMCVAHRPSPFQA